MDAICDSIEQVIDLLSSFKDFKEIKAHKKQALISAINALTEVHRALKEAKTTG